MDDPRSSETVQPLAMPNPGRTNQQSGIRDQGSALSLALRPSLHGEDERDALLIKLLFAAHRLAASQIHQYGPTGRVCAACGGEGIGLSAIEHVGPCDVGLIDTLIGRIAACYEQRVDRAAQVSGEFAEPWRVDKSAVVLDCLGREVYDPWGSELLEHEHDDYAARVAASVNACAGIPLAALVRAARPSGARPARPAAPQVTPFEYPDVAQGGAR